MMQNNVAVGVSQSTVGTTVTQPDMWDSGVCDCCDDMGICCCALWCFPCFQCSTVSNFGECVCLPMMDPGCAGYCGNSVVCPPVSMAMRAAVRERYKIPGSIMDDCCSLYWCFSCTWCQMAREIKKRRRPVSIMTAQTTSVNVSMNAATYQQPQAFAPPQPYPQPQPYPPPQAYPQPQPYQPYPQPVY